MITCPECGQEAPDDAKFCDRCGQGLSKAASSVAQSHADAADAADGGRAVEGRNRDRRADESDLD